MGKEARALSPHSSSSQKSSHCPSKEKKEEKYKETRGKDRRTGRAENKIDSWDQGLTAHTRATLGTLTCSYESKAREISVKKK